ncbi:MAG: hypothetical protein M1837_000286, partial [Sclerophora amabilis]
MLVLHSIVVAAATLLPVVSSVAVNLEPRDNVIEVKVSPSNNSVVKFSLKNTADKEIHLLKYGSFLDETPVQKAVVYKDGAELPFTGVLRRYRTSELNKDAFVTVGAGETVEKTVTLAAVYDMKTSGKYDVVTQGVFATASEDFSTVSDESIYFRSNDLSVDIDGEKAALVPPAVKVLDKKTILTECSGSANTALRRALANAASLATAAANQAASGNAAKFQEYFKSTSSSTRSTVAARLRAVAREASSTTSGATRHYCGDPYGYCSPNVLAYTLPAYNIIANCPIYYSGLPALTSTCHAQDQATTTLHEFTHAPGTYRPGTIDNGYGYAAATALTSSQAVANADSYALYAN